jgi:hypothetical protein
MRVSMQVPRQQMDDVAVKQGELHTRRAADPERFGRIARKIAQHPETSSAGKSACGGVSRRKRRNRLPAFQSARKRHEAMRPRRMRS